MLTERTLNIYRCFFDPPEMPSRSARAVQSRAATHAWARRLLQRTADEAGLGALPSLQRDRFGKPHFGESYPLYFNLSHSGGAAALAVSDAPVGIDIECRDGRRWEALSHRFFSETEQAFIAAHAPEDRPQAFILLWTCKESLYKYIGCGLGQGLSRYTLQCDTDGQMPVTDSRGTRPDSANPLPRIEKIRASYEARILYFHSRQERHDGRIYRLTVCSPYPEAAFQPKG